MDIWGVKILLNTASKFAFFSENGSFKIFNKMKTTAQFSSEIIQFPQNLAASAIAIKNVSQLFSSGHDLNRAARWRDIIHVGPACSCLPRYSNLLLVQLPAIGLGPHEIVVRVLTVRQIEGMAEFVRGCSCCRVLGRPRCRIKDGQVPYIDCVPAGKDAVHGIVTVYLRQKPDIEPRRLDVVIHYNLHLKTNACLRPPDTINLFQYFFEVGCATVTPVKVDAQGDVIDKQGRRVLMFRSRYRSYVPGR
jgi:hypothetical protein